MVYATARRVTGDASLAEDVTQEAFLELARKGRSVTESVGAWLHRVAWRRACDVVRAEATRQRYESAAASVADGRECAWEELEPVFDEALAELLPEERAVIVEHYLEGRPQTEIAKRMGVSQSSVSRLLERSMENLRARLKSKGLLCGASLGATLTTLSSEAAPAALVASLGKLALSSLGSVAGASAGETWLGTVLAMKGKVVLVVVVIGVVSVAGFDLASEHSRIAGWLGGDDHRTEASVRETRNVRNTGLVSGSALDKQRLLAEAKAIWKSAPRFDEKEFNRLGNVLIMVRDIDKRFAAMRAMGVNLSRADFDRVAAAIPDLMAFDERKSFNAGLQLMRDLQAAWATQSPRESLAWEFAVFKSAPDFHLPFSAPWIRTHPEAWAAFVEAGPDPQLGARAALWIQEQDDPGSIWSKAAGAGMKRDAIKAGIFAMLSQGPPEMLLAELLRCPEETFRTEKLMNLVPRLAPEQVMQAAHPGFSSDPQVVNLLRALAGDPSASFVDASARLTKDAAGGGEKAELASASQDCAPLLYAAWLRTDAKAALQHAVRSGNQGFLTQMMTEAAKGDGVNEELIVTSFTSVKNRDHALGVWYQARAGGSGAAALESIIHSSYVEDQIEAAKPVLQQWTVQSPQQAGAWLESLPASEDRSELAAVIATKWAKIDPEAAFAFAQHAGLGFDHGWESGFGWGGRVLADDKLEAILAQTRNDPNFNRMLTTLVGYRYPSDPGKGIALLSRFGTPGWQTLIVDDAIHWLERNDARDEAYSMALAGLDLSAVEPSKITKAAQLLVNKLAGDGRLNEAFNWTLRLPADLAPLSRSEALGKLDISIPSRREAAEQWIRQASISEEERSALLKIIASR